MCIRDRVQAVCISREPSLKFSKRLRVVRAGTGAFHRHSLCTTPVKWIPQNPHLPLPRNRSAHALRAARARGLGKEYHGGRTLWALAALVVTERHVLLHTID